MKMYYVSLTPGLYKTFGTRFKAFWCCTGTGAEEFAKLADTIYFHDADSLYVNLFIASELNWKEKKFGVVQETNFPEEEGTTLTVKTSAPAKMPIRVRIPYWATSGATIAINGKKQEIAAKPGSYATLDQTWHDGDKITVSLPMSLHAAPTPDDPTVRAAMYGPVVLAGLLGKQNLTTDKVYGPEGPDEKNTIQVASIKGNASGNSVNWVEEVKGEKLKFKTVGQLAIVDLAPLSQVMDQRYTVYFKLGAKLA
jgi:hypothetical protein